MDAYTPGLFELKFAEERTRQAAPRVGLLVLLKTFQQLGYFVAQVPGFEIIGDLNHDTQLQHPSIYL